MSLVLSTKTHANIVHMDASEALSIPGVVDFICEKDVPGQNILHGIDEQIFADGKVILMCCVFLLTILSGEIVIIFIKCLDV